MPEYVSCSECFDPVPEDTLCDCEPTACVYCHDRHIDARDSVRGVPGVER